MEEINVAEFYQEFNGGGEVQHDEPTGLLAEAGDVEEKHVLSQYVNGGGKLQHEAIGVVLAARVREACCARAEAAVEQAASAHAAMVAAAAERHGGRSAAKRAARAAAAYRRAVAAAELAVEALQSLP